MKIWFVSHYSMPPQYEMRVKTQMYAHFLNEMGHETKIFSASTIHNTDINLITDSSLYVERKYDDLDFVHIKCDNYSGNGIKRILNMQQFANKFSTVAKKFEQPDVVVADANCTNYMPIYKYCKKRNIPFYVDVRDLWPESIVEYYGFKKSNPIIKYLYHKEKCMYKQATGIIFSMEGGKDYIKDKGWNDIDFNKVHYINNGVNVEEFYDNIKKYPYIDEDLSESNVYKIVYAGSIRTANNLMSVVEAARLLNGHKDIRFFIFGDGDDKANLEKYCDSIALKNVYFKGNVEKRYIPSILKQCDLSILNYKKANTHKYGGSQNKLFEYLAVGNPVLMTVDVNYNVVSKRNCGIVLDEPDPQKIANAILELYNMSLEEKKIIGDNAKNVALEYDYKNLTDKLLAIIQQ